MPANCACWLQVTSRQPQELTSPTAALRLPLASAAAAPSLFAAPLAGVGQLLQPVARPSATDPQQAAALLTSAAGTFQGEHSSAGDSSQPCWKSSAKLCFIRLWLLRDLRKRMLDFVVAEPCNYPASRAFSLIVELHIFHAAVEDKCCCKGQTKVPQVFLGQVCCLSFCSIKTVLETVHL